MRRCLSMRRNTDSATIEMTPMIDMVFLLLIFYIVSAHFVQESAVPINRPESSTATVVRDSFLSVTITKKGMVYAAGRVVKPGDVSAIKNMLASGGNKRILIQADREVPTALLLAVLDTCKQSGAESVDVAAVKP